MGPRAMLLILNVFLALLGTCSGQDNTQFYSCPEGQAMVTIQHKIENIHDCEQSWAVHNENIAFYHGHGQCTTPCVSVSHEGITLRKCVNVTLTITCERKQYVENDQRIHFIGRKVRTEPASAVPIQDDTPSTPQPSQHMGLVAALCLFSVMGVAFIVHQLLHRDSGQTSS